MLFVLCYPRLGTHEEAALEAFRRKHEPMRANMVRAHVTLVFGVRHVSPDTLTRLAEAIASKTAPLEFSIDKVEVKAHEQGDHNLFLKIDKGRDALIALNRAFYAGELSPERGGIEFDPHITIASNADLTAVAKAASEAQPLSAMVGRLDAFDIVARDGHTLTEIATVPLVG
ncbi:MAG: hypothetical protein GC190_10665 [Alphaproteobacteria bacterium]|nr:hypothetical protein [Alphaproteobacteria bacterium]